MRPSTQDYIRLSMHRLAGAIDTFLGFSEHPDFPFDEEFVNDLLIIRKAINRELRRGWEDI